ncbi:MAG: TIGR03619 family F420-dependent LLM class oxidoreductase [Chloroflexota bacterium]|nr:TIGR03619 family F420-dependent LLM class oxidoreductase [Chloroflexota bacterium]
MRRGCNGPIIILTSLASSDADQQGETILELLAVLPTEDPSLAPRFLVDAAVRAEELGYDGVRMPDHLLFPDGFSGELGGVYDPLVTLASIAAVTDRITLGTSVLILPLRNPFAVAKQAATLAKLSANRFILGVGVGWNEQEFTATGATFRRRGHSTDEAIRLIKHLHAVGHGPFESDAYPFTTGVFAPTLDAPVPILIGGTSDAALRRAARFADIWEAFNLETEEFEERVAHLRALTDRLIKVGLNLKWDSDSTPLDEFVDQVASWERAGAESLAVHFGIAESMLERMEALIHAVRW